VIWSVSHATAGRSASTSCTHGGFDNDRPTMNSVLRRILESDDIVEFPEEAAARAAALREPTGLPYEIEALVGPFDGGGPGSTVASSGPAEGMAASSAWTAGPVVSPAAPPMSAGVGRRRALCVGIDRYPTMPLGGCVADAREWVETLRSLGFETEILLDEAATRAAIVDGLRRLIAGSGAGDVLVFQFAGHGTQLDDLDGDDVGGTALGTDEALCPYDIADGAFVIDDDVAEVFRTIPERVNVTCFIDCCHSGTVTRLMIGATQRAGAGGDRRPRWLPATPEMRAAHRRYRAQLGRTRSAGPRNAAEMREVLFSACLDTELAYESGGHGDFTQRATRILRDGIGGLSNQEFQRRVAEAFGSGAQQHPDLHCAPHARAHALLQPLTGAAPSNGGGAGERDGGMLRTRPDTALLAEAFRTMADMLQARG
jgi:Caspase domain